MIGSTRKQMNFAYFIILRCRGSRFLMLVSLRQLNQIIEIQTLCLTVLLCFPIFQGQIECNSETVFELAAHVLQASLGDYVE